LGVAAGYDEAGGGILGVDFADGVAGLGVGGGSYGAGVEDDDRGCCRIAGGRVAVVEELAFEGGAIGLRGAAAELLDVEGSHRFGQKFGKDLHRVHGGRGEEREETGFPIALNEQRQDNRFDGVREGDGESASRLLFVEVNILLKLPSSKWAPRNS
jgi:hypothetical protein